MRYARLLKIAEREAAELEAGLPDEIRAALADIAVFFEPVPQTWRLEQGVEPDQLGLFEGPLRHEDIADQPPQITLWLENLWDCAGDEATFRHEVRTTLLHEIGHYLGYDEDDLAERGLG